MMNSILMALSGGALIGFAASLMLVFNGRVTGISGIVNGLLGGLFKDGLWRLTFILGLLVGGALLGMSHPELFVNTSGRSVVLVTLAGLIVGFGTVMGSGCTSGHGVCGIARFSVRSLLATATFMIIGILTATVLKYWLGV
ncbi:YeeE/YedE thiosulfate transporter family protein [Bdellovibrio bacteriovorus]|uniref:YeeE/YedE family protein n=1 Tax=Bdellovibrio bacteriovorus TaxID=959 RepID=UPI0021D00A94|nr:YeeE/YedE thiosulfate transporter family protein [Bdellovibrio bacteriovorus]UXR65012.1 YeeE/YedE thiosulfate transporter family protein [Bdellovibrio bacteriovorus]